MEEEGIELKEIISTQEERPGSPLDRNVLEIANIQKDKPGDDPESTSSNGQVCSLPGCTRPRYKDASGTILNYCGRTHAALDQIQRNESKENNEILFYNRGERYFEFTNFAEYPILLDDEEWPTTEHYFQAQKFIGTPYFKYIRTLQTPRDAFSLSRQPQVSQWLRDDWEQVKLDIMYKALLAKFFQHSNLRDMLLKTGEKKLIEHTSNDSYWGDGGNGTGQNHLGRLLMKVRSELEPDANHLDTHLFEKNGMLNIHSTYETIGPFNSNASNGVHRSLGRSNECLDSNKSSGTSGAYTANELYDNDVPPKDTSKGSCGAADANASIDSSNTNEQSPHTASDGCLDAKGSSTTDTSNQSLDTPRLNNAHASNELSDVHVVGPLLDRNGTFDGNKQPLLDSNGQTHTETLNALPATTGSRDNINSTDAAVSSHSLDSVELSNVNTKSPNSNVANQPVDTTEQPPYTNASNECFDINKSSGASGAYTSNESYDNDVLPPKDIFKGSCDANAPIDSPNTNKQSPHTASGGCLDAKGSSTADASNQSLDTPRLNNTHASNELSDVDGPLLDRNGTFDGNKQPLLDSNGQTHTETLNALPATTGSRDNINSTDATVSNHSLDSVELSNVNTKSPDSNIANQPVDTTEQPPYTSTSNESSGVRTSNGLHNTDQLLDARSGSSNANTRNMSFDTNDQPLPDASAPAGTETINGLLAINGLTGMATLIPSPICEINQSPDITSGVCSPSIQRDQLTKGTAKQPCPEVQFDDLNCFLVEHVTNDASRHCANSEGIEEHQFMTKNEGMIVEEFHDHLKQGVPATNEGYDKEPTSEDLCVHVKAASGISVLHNVICDLVKQPYQSNPEKRVVKVRSQIKLKISITPDSLKSIMDNSKDIEVELDISKGFSNKRRSW
ncbi:hypothetical protein EMCRGX_G002381 [Ephydatia muelleri]